MRLEEWWKSFTEKEGCRASVSFWFYLLLILLSCSYSSEEGEMKRYGDGV